MNMDGVKGTSEVSENISGLCKARKKIGTHCDKDNKKSIINK